MRFLYLVLLASLLLGSTFAQEDVDNSGEPGLEEENIEVDQSAEDPEAAAKRAEKEAAAQQLQEFYVTYLKKKTSPGCKTELEAVIANPPEDNTQSPFTDKCDKEIQSVSAFFQPV